MGKQVSTLSVALKANVAGFSGPIKSAAKPVQELTEHTSGLGATIGTLGAVGAVAVGVFEALKGASASFELAAEYETAGVQLKALTGNANVAAATLKSLQEMSVKSPFAFPELLDTSKRLLAAGVNAQALPKILDEAGNVAAGVGAPIGEIGDIFARVATEGKLGSRELREFGRQGIPVVQTLAAQFHTTAAGIDAMAENGQIGFNQLEGAFAAMTSKGGKFAGILDAQAQTVGGRFHTLTATIEEDGAAVGEKLISAFHVADILGATTNAIGMVGNALSEVGHSKVFEAIASDAQKLGQIIYAVDVSELKFLGSTVEQVGEKLYRAFHVEQIIGAVVTGLKAFNAELNKVLDYVMKLEGITPEIKKPEIPAPDPVKVTTLLDPSTQQLQIQPEIKLSPAFRAGSAEAQAARYGTSRGMTFGAGGGSIGTAVAPANAPMLPTGGTPVPPPPAPALKHAPNSAFRNKFGFSGTRTELSDATLGPDGLYHIKSRNSGISGALTPEQFDNLKSEGQSTDYKAYKPSAAEQGNLDKRFGKFTPIDAKKLNSMSLHDKYVATHGGAKPDSIQQRNLSAQWRTQASADQVAAWNKAHPGQTIAGGLLPKPSDAQLRQAVTAAAGQPGSLGPLSGSFSAQPSSPGTQISKPDIDTTNNWLYRIELNTRSSGTGATIVNF